jgi:ATP-dependent Clp protease ATP-binding subunit ClpC
MLERFTSRARRVIVLATEEARSRRHATIQPEHLLIGILRDGDGMAVKVLERLGVQSDALIAAVGDVLTNMSASPAASEPAFSPELRDVLQAAIESQLQSHHVIGTENLLLGLLAHEGSAANGLLRAAGIDLDGVRRITSLFYDSMAIPITAENIRFIATSKWRIVPPEQR